MTVNERTSVPRLYEWQTRFRGLWNLMSFWGGNKIKFVSGGFLALHRLIVKFIALQRLNDQDVFEKS